MSKYDVKKLREQVKKAKGGRQRDPHEFVPAKATETVSHNYRFFVLPPLLEGEKCHGGAASKAMESFFVRHGQHWVNKQPHECPRCYDDSPCSWCERGFDLLKEIPKGEAHKAERTKVSKAWLANSHFAVNLFFPQIDQNPPEVRGKVMWFDAPKTVYDIWEEAINRDDPGDKEDPKAYGVIYDEYAAFLFQLEVTEQGGFNNYKTSKFLAQTGARPIFRNKEGNADQSVIEKILANRHDLFKKIDVPDADKLAKLLVASDTGADEIAAVGPDSGDTFAAESGEEGAPTLDTLAEETAVEAPPPKPATAAAPKAAAKPAAPAAAKPAAKPAAAPVKPPAKPAAPAPAAAAKPAAKPAAAKPAAKPAAAPEPAADGGDSEIDDILSKLNSGEGTPVADETAPVGDEFPAE